MDILKNKQLILKILAKQTKNLRGKKSQFMFCSENDISTSIISTIERAMKDPQLTTVFKLAEAFNKKPSEFVKLIEDELPKNFSLIEK
jgi:transcriptional regulator with XRE-family HTH domain